MYINRVAFKDGRKKFTFNEKVITSVREQISL